MVRDRKSRLKAIRRKKAQLKMIEKVKSVTHQKAFLSIFVACLTFIIFGKSFSRYYDAMINKSDLPLAPWNITINNQKISSAGKINVIVDPIVTETTTNTKTYKNKIVPGCKGYFDIEINPTGTGVSMDYIIDFNPENLPGGMIYTKYETLDENKSVIATCTTFPSDAKLTGTMPIVDGKLLESKNILRYRIYFEYIDDDTLNTTAPNVEEQSSIMLDVILKQSV